LTELLQKIKMVQIYCLTLYIAFLLWDLWQFVRFWLSFISL